MINRTFLLILLLLFVAPIHGYSVAQISPLEDTSEANNEELVKDETPKVLPPEVTDDNSSPALNNASPRTVTLEVLEVQKIRSKAEISAVNLGLLQTLIGAIGTAALVYTLWLTQKTTRASLKALNISEKRFEAELRPILLFGQSMEKITTHGENMTMPNGQVVSGIYTMFKIPLFNYGNGVCTVKSIRSGSQLAPIDTIPSVTMSGEEFKHATPNAPKTPCGYIQGIASEADIASLKTRESWLLIPYEVLYYSIDENPKNYKFEGIARIIYEGEFKETETSTATSMYHMMIISDDLKNMEH